MGDRGYSSQGRSTGRTNPNVPSSGGAATSNTSSAANNRRVDDVQQRNRPNVSRAPAYPNIPRGGAPQFFDNIPPRRAPFNVALPGAFPVPGNMQVNVQQPFMPFWDPRANMPRTAQTPQYGDEFGPWWPPQHPSFQQQQQQQQQQHQGQQQPHINQRQLRPPTPPPPPPPAQPNVQQQRDQHMQLLNQVAPGHPPEGARPRGQPGVALTVPPRPGQPMHSINVNIATRIQGNSTYGDLVRNAPPPNAVPPLDVDISMMEICAFFPCWFQFPDVIMRARRNGWSRKEIAKATLHALNQLNRANLKTAEDRIQKQISEGGKKYQGLADNERWDSNTHVDALGQEDDLTANLWELRASYQHNDHGEWTHVLLAPIANNVTNWPVGQDRKLVTRCLRYAQANPGLNLDTSHWHLIIHSQNFQHPPKADHNDDERARVDLGNNVADP